MDKLETGFFTEFWRCVLQRFDVTNKKLQQANLDLNLTILLLKSLLTFLHSLRERFDELKKAGAELSGMTNLAENICTRKRNVILNPLNYGRGKRPI